MTSSADTLQATQDALHLSTMDLWWDYFALGGERTPLEIEAIVFGALVAGSHDHDLLATALNERSSSRGPALELSALADLPTDRRPLDARRPHRPARSDDAFADAWLVLLERSVDAPGIARRSVRSWLTAWGCPPDFVADAVLVVSELVANAVQHASSTALLRAGFRGDRLRLEVHDTSVDPPVRRAQDVHRPSSPLMTGGSGLHIVAALAETWGWSSTATGKSVWSELRYDTDVPDR